MCLILILSSSQTLVTLALWFKNQNDAMLLKRVTLTGNGRSKHVSSSSCCIYLLYSEIISLIYQKSIYFNIFDHNNPSNKQLNCKPAPGV